MYFNLFGGFSFRSCYPLKPFCYKRITLLSLRQNKTTSKGSLPNRRSYTIGNLWLTQHSLLLRSQPILSAMLLQKRCGDATSYNHLRYDTGKTYLLDLCLKATFEVIKQSHSLKWKIKQ